MMRPQKMTHRTKEGEDAADVSVLRTPIQLNGKPVEQILNGVHYGTPELRDLLMDECDIILECKVCRALFRDLANFIAHKRRYCSKSVSEDSHYAIAKMPDEKVYVIQPQDPESSSSSVRQARQRSKPSLEETVARIRSGELGHSQAFKVYTDAANKLQQQKEEMKVATIRTRAIPTNANAVFMDVNMASVNIHERPAASAGNLSGLKSTNSTTAITRKARERVNSRKKSNSNESVRARTLRKDCKNSEELQKLLLQELKEIRNKVKQKNQGSDSVKRAPMKREQSKIKTNSSEKDNSSSSNVRTVHLEKEAQSLKSADSGIKTDIDAKSPDMAVKTAENGNKPLSKPPDTMSSPKGKCEMPFRNPSKPQEASKVHSVSLKLKSPNTTCKLRRKSLICLKCHTIFSTRQSLSFHNQVIHSSKKTFFPCLYCPNVFYYFQSVIRHLKLNHFKTKAEINSLRKELRAKSYTKVLSDVNEENSKEQPTGSRKSLRHKRRAYGGKMSSNSSYVLHPVKKRDRKLSAKKEALSSPEATEQTKETNASLHKSKDTISSDAFLTVKDEVESPSKYSLTSSFLQEIEISGSNTKNKATESNEKSSPAASTFSLPRQKPSVLRKMKVEESNIRSKAPGERVMSSAAPSNISPPRQNPLHSCKKCRRLFGRMLTYKNHIKICQGKVTTLSQSSRRSRARARRKLLKTKEGLAISTRGHKMCKTPPIAANNDEFDRIPIKQINSPHETKRTSRRDVLKSLRASRQDDSGSESSNFSERGRRIKYEDGNSKTRSSSVPATRSCDINSANKLEEVGLKKAERQHSNDRNIKTKTEKKEISGSPLEDEKVQVHKLVKSEQLINPAAKADASVQLKTKTASQRASTQKSNFDAITSPMPLRSEKHSSLLKEEGENNDKNAHALARELRGGKESASGDSSHVNNSVLHHASKDRKSNASEKDSRHKISHLVPRSCKEVSAAMIKDTSSVLFVPDTSPSDERPRRKRKIPTRNIEAIEMLSKIHNPEKDDSVCKKRMLSQERDLNSSRPSNTRERLAIESKIGDTKDQTLERKIESDEEGDKSYSDDLEARESRPTKGRSRMFVLGRKTSKGRKLLRSYDNARVDKLIDTQNSKCLVCGEQYTQLYNLRRHIIRIHLQWSRYQCKLCRYASFDRSECTTHIVRNHKRVVNVEDTQAVSDCITDLAKLGSQAMSKKKSQTLRDKNKRENNDANIYARPNVRKMPRLAERTMIHERSGSESCATSRSPEKQKQKSDNATPKDAGCKTLRQPVKADTNPHDVSDNLSKKSSLPFNISTRNSPRVFDTSPYKSSESSNSDTQSEVAVLHTRKGMYTKTIPALPLKEKSIIDAKEVMVKKDGMIVDESQDNSVEMKRNAGITKKNVSQTSQGNVVDSPIQKQDNIFDKLALPDTALYVGKSDSSNEEKLRTDSSKLYGSNDMHILTQGERKDKSVCSSSCDRIVTKSVGDKSLFSQELQSLPNDPPSAVSGVHEANKLKQCGEICPHKLSESSPEKRSQICNLKGSLSPPVTDSKASPKSMKISPSYVVINSSRLPSEIRAGASSCTVSKALNFADTADVPKDTLLDEICDDGKSISVSPAVVVSSSSE